MIQQILLASFAIFSMFFGSGNLVFPLLVGRLAGPEWPYAALGIIITGVFIPLMGLVGVILTKGSLAVFFRPLGYWASLLVPLLIICLLGPFGVIPRCITVAYAGAKNIFPGVSLAFFSLGWCALLLFLTPHREKIIPFIGKYFTPIKITLLIFLIGIGITNAPASANFPAITSSVFYQGILGGYQTMDLLAAFFFALGMVAYFQQDNAHVLFKNIISAVIGCGLLGVFYIGFIYIGARYQPLLKDLPPEEILPFIAAKCLGNKSAVFLNTTIIVACLTTSMALMAAFTDFLMSLLKNRCSPLPINICSVVLTAAVSLLNFKGIALFLTPILEILYPVLIILTLYNIAVYFFKKETQTLSTEL